MQHLCDDKTDVIWLERKLTDLVQSQHRFLFWHSACFGQSLRGLCKWKVHREICVLSRSRSDFCREGSELQYVECKTASRFKYCFWCVLIGKCCLSQAWMLLGDASGKISASCSSKLAVVNLFCCCGRRALSHKGLHCLAIDLHKALVICRGACNGWNSSTYLQGCLLPRDSWLLLSGERRTLCPCNEQDYRI